MLYKCFVLGGYMCLVFYIIMNFHVYWICVGVVGLYLKLAFGLT